MLSTIDTLERAYFWHFCPRTHLQVKPRNEHGDEDPEVWHALHDVLHQVAQLVGGVVGVHSLLHVALVNLSFGGVDKISHIER